MKNNPAEILFISSYPPRECGIATYSQDLIKAIHNKFDKSLMIRICAIESGETNYTYPAEVKYVLKTSIPEHYKETAVKINNDKNIKIVLIQHEFGFFRVQEQSFLQMIVDLIKPVVVVFHTVLPNPDEILKQKIKSISAVCQSFVVMTKTSAEILTRDYDIPAKKITVIAHGTHLVPYFNDKSLKIKYGLQDKKVLTTFGLLSAGKSIETTLEALPAIIACCPDVVFLVIGKTHPEVKFSEGERYREFLQQKTQDLSITEHVIFVNEYVALPDLLEYLQLTDIYLFTTNDRNQAVSGTFVYAMSCACPIISTPIPHAKEVLTEDTGIIFDFLDSQQLAKDVIHLLNDEALRRNISSNTLHKIVATAWENSPVAHAMLFEELAGINISLQYELPEISLSHLKRMTTNTGIIQFSKINQPDISSGYTLDDNARALITMCMYYKLTSDKSALNDIKKYLDFIKRCIQPEGNFINYIDKDNKITDQNKEGNLDDANGRAIWALGVLISMTEIMPVDIISEAESIMERSILRIGTVHSTRAMAFAIKGIFYSQKVNKSEEDMILLKTLANRLVEMYKHESAGDWDWFEGYLTYGNSILPEALLYSWILTGEPIYKEIAVQSFSFLLSQIFNENGIEVISNKKWLIKGKEAGQFGEQPIDVAYTMMTLSLFYDVLKGEDYRKKMEIAFSWFLGNNRLHQIIYNPSTGGCYDGLEETHVNLNQGAESTVSYLMARLTLEKYKTPKLTPKVGIRVKRLQMN